MGCRPRMPMPMAGLAVMFMVIMAATPAHLQAASQVTEIMLSDQADAKGVVAEAPKQVSPLGGGNLRHRPHCRGAEKGKRLPPNSSM